VVAGYERQENEADYATSKPFENWTTSKVMLAMWH